MAITSFKRFLKVEKPKPSDFVRYLQMILQGVSEHAVEGDALSLSTFRAEMEEFSGQLTEESSAEEILVVVGAAIQKMRDHNQRASLFVKSYGKELQTMLTMMSSTIAFLASSSKAGVAQLHSLEQNLSAAAEIDDVKILRVRLSECLAAVQSESARLQSDSRERIHALQKAVESTNNTLFPSTSVLDQSTGLQPRANAEEAIKRSINEKRDVLVAVFVVDRLASLNSRFGRNAGDEVLLMVAQHLMGKLPETNPPFRWSGPAFVSVVELTPGSPVMERKIKQIASERLEKHIESGGRSLMLPVSCSVLMQKVGGSDSAEVVFRALDTFVAANGGGPQ